MYTYKTREKVTKPKTQRADKDYNSQWKKIKRVVCVKKWKPFLKMRQYPEAV